MAMLGRIPSARPQRAYLRSVSTPEWRLNADERRLVQLLLWLDDRDEGESQIEVAPFYDGDQSRMRQARSDLRDLEVRDWASPYFGGAMTLAGMTAVLSPTGRSAADTLRRNLKDQPGRRTACRSALVFWLYQVDALEVPTSAVDWIEMADTDHGLFYNDAFTELELERAAAWLHRHGLVDGPTVAEADAPVLAYLTDDGVDCAERYDSDTTKFLEARQMQQQLGATFHVTGQNVQVATGDHSQQVITLGPTAHELASALQGLVEIVQGLGLADEADDLDVLAEEAVEDITSDRPTGKPAAQLLNRVKGLASTSASQAVNTAVTLAVTAASDDVAALVRALGG